MEFNEYISENKNKKGLYPWSKDRVFIEGAELNRSVDFLKRVAGASDYAIACGGSRSDNYKSPSGHYKGNVWLSTPYVDASNKVLDRSVRNQYVYHIDMEGKVAEFATCSMSDYLICPAFNLSLKALKESESFNGYTLGLRNLCYHTIKFPNLVFPQTKVEEKNEFKLELAYQTGNLYHTGKKFSGSFNGLCELEQHEEFYFEGRRFVRVVLENQCRFNDGSVVEKDKPVWFEVEPINFIIRNWEEMPKNINPNGDESATELNLRSEDGLLSGIPFDLGLNSNRWQQSIIRYYLNSISGKAYAFVNNKGQLGFNKKKTYDFKENGFLEEAQFDEKQLSAALANEVKKSENNHSNKQKNCDNEYFETYDVSIDNRALSVEQQLRFYLKNGRSFMLHGVSGVGKSRRVKNLDPDCVMLQLRNGMLPEEIVGKTAYKNENEKTVWLAPTWYQRLCEVCEAEPNKNHVLFIDEVTNVRPSEQSLIYHIIQSRTIDGQNGKLPDNCVVAAAGNSISDSNAAYNMPEPLFRRFYAHVELDIDVKEFLIWGSEKSQKGDGRLNIHPVVAAFIAKEGEEVLFSKYDAYENQSHVVDPRGWEQVSNILYDNGEVFKIELIANKIGLDMAGKFVKFAKNQLLSRKKILSGEYDESQLPKDENSIVALILRLRYAKEKEEIRKFVSEHFGVEKLEFYDQLIGTEELSEKELGGE